MASGPGGRRSRPGPSAFWSSSARQRAGRKEGERARFTSSGGRWVRGARPDRWGASPGDSFLPEATCGCSAGTRQYLPGPRPNDGLRQAGERVPLRNSLPEAQQSGRAFGNRFRVAPAGPRLVWVPGAFAARARIPAQQAAMQGQRQNGPGFRTKIDGTELSERAMSEESNRSYQAFALPVAESQLPQRGGISPSQTDSWSNVIERAYYCQPKCEIRK
jgi:hypothetical protein